MVDYILTDKTGTLTANEMVFRDIAVKDKVYSQQYLVSHPQEIVENKSIRSFFEAMMICHEVVRDYLKEEYQGSSPDEVCFINFTKTIGYEFVKRTQTHLEFNIREQKVLYELVDVISFTSRKRMTVVVKNP